MALIDHVTVNLHHNSGLARDDVVNTFTFFGETDLSGAQLGGIEAALMGFYNHVFTTPPHAVSHYLGPQISRTAHPTVRHYNIDGLLSGAAHGSPFRVTDFVDPLGDPMGGNPLPSEVSVALSYHAATTAPEFGTGHTRPRARQRGRVFIGPMMMNIAVVAAEAVTSRPRVHPDVRSVLNQAAAFLNSSLPTGVTWAVWSRKNAAVLPVIGSSVDDAFDTQRRRGERAVVRDSLTF